MKNKKFIKNLILCLSFVMGISIFTGCSKTTKTSTDKKEVDKKIVSNKELLTDSDKKLLKRHWISFNEDEKNEFADIVDKYKKIDKEKKEKIKKDYERIIKEKIKADEISNKKNTKDLIAGEYIIGKHIAEGEYYIFPIKESTGNLTIYDGNGKVVTDEVFTNDGLGITQYKGFLPLNGKIKISGTTMHFKPLNFKKQSYKEFKLFSGYWSVGTDLTQGRYKISTNNKSGNILVIDYEDKKIKTNEVLGTDMNQTEIIVTLKNEDYIKIDSLDEVKFTPIQ